MTTLSCGIFAGSLLLLWPKRRRAYWMILALVGFTLLPLGCGGNESSSTSKSNHACRHIYLPDDCDGRNDAKHNQLHPCR